MSNLKLRGNINKFPQNRLPTKLVRCKNLSLGWHCILLDTGRPSTKSLKVLRYIRLNLCHYLLLLKAILQCTMGRATENEESLQYNIYLNVMFSNYS
jgi:hypothetical protein